MYSASFAQDIICALRAAESDRALVDLVASVAHDMGFRHYALIHHDDLGQARPDRVDLKMYPSAIVERLIDGRGYRWDPIIRSCLFSGGAFLWSEIDRIIRLDRRDREAFAAGVREGLNEGITVPYVRLGECTGSCTFAGAARPEHASKYLGIAQMVGVFAFQSALRLVGQAPRPVEARPHLHPRPRDCVILAGRGYSNKEIARALALAPRTVDGYLTEARRLFDAHDRTELVVSAVLAGEIETYELRRQPG